MAGEIWDETADDDSDDDTPAPPQRSSADITEGEKYEFLQHVRLGLNRQEAAQLLGYKGRHFRAITSPKSPYYDEDFARSFGEIIGSLEFEHNRLERLREAAMRRALGGSDRLLERLLMVHDPDWRVLRESKTEVNVNVRALVETHFKSLPTDKLRELIELVEGNIIEGEGEEILSLPQGHPEAA